MPPMTGKHILCEMLRAEGVRYVFGNPGTTETPFLDALQDYPDVQYVTFLQEASAVAAADGYARATRRPAFVNVHVSAGFANALGNLYNAYRGGTPLVVTAGQSDTRIIHREPTLWSNMVNLGREYTKWSAEVLHAADLPMLVRRAFRVAATPPTGPVFLTLPWDVLDAEAEAQVTPSSPVYGHVRPDTAAVAAAVELLARAERPLMVVGDRVAQSGGVQEAVRLAELLGAPVYAAAYSEVNFPQSHPLFQGALNLGWPGRAVRATLEGADAILAVGCDVFAQFVYTPEPLLGPDARLVHLDVKAWEIEKQYPVAVGMWADPRAGMADLADALEGALPGTAREAARDRLAAARAAKEQRREAFWKRARDLRGKTPIAPEVLMATLKEVAPQGTIVVDEAITNRPPLHAAFEFSTPGELFGIRGGGLGFALPGAVGVKLAHPDRPVLCVSGDGAAMYVIQALWSAARHRLPIVYVICNNGSYKVLKEGMVRYLAGTGRESAFVGMDFTEQPLNAAKVAEGFGVLGLRVERPEELRPALERAFAAGSPTLVDVVVDENLRTEALQQDWLSWQRT